MLTLNIDIDYGRPEEMQKSTPNPELTDNYINFAVNNFYAGGLESQWRRLWGRIQRKLDAALDKKEYEVQLERAEFDFITRAFAGAKFDSSLSKFVVVLEDILEKLKNGQTS